MLKAVLDTNIIISGLNFSGSPAQVLELAAKVTIQNVLRQTTISGSQGEPEYRIHQLMCDLYHPVNTDHHPNRGVPAAVSTQKKKKHQLP